MKKILFPTDFSTTAENALRYAIKYAEQLPGTIQVMNVVIPIAEAIDVYGSSNMLIQTQIKGARTRTEKFLEKGVSQIQTDSPIDQLPGIISNVEVGLPVSKVVEIAERDKIDLIVMGTQGEHSNWNRFFGSVSSGVIQKAPCPTLVVPENATYTGLKKVAIAINLKESDPWEIFKTTQLLGDHLEHLDCVHVNPTGKTVPTEINMMELEAFYKANPQPYKMGYHFLAGDNIQASLNKFVNKNDIDLLVMVGPHMTTFQKLFLQSTTKKMVFQTKVPLLVWN